ncbi:MAG: radical SAM protein, partial [Nitrospirota bacterium]
KPLQNAGHTVHVLDFMKVKDTDAVLVSALNKHKPDIVGFSLRNIDNQKYQGAQEFITDYVRWVQIANRTAPTIIGGSAVMSMPEKIFERVPSTYAMAGQGDRTFPMFLEELEIRTSGFETPGIMWRENGDIHRNEGLLNGYHDRGTIDWSVIDIRRYRKSYFNCCVITKTGCPHRCLFCDTGSSFGSSWETREPEAILDDLRRDAREYGFNRLDYFFIDALFNEPLNWAKSLLEAIIRSELKLCFSVIIEPTTIDREFARMLRRAGCLMVTTLLNSMDDELLSRMHRPFHVESVNRTFELFEDERINYMPQFLMGGPGETRETVLKNMSHLKRWNPLLTDAGYGLRIMPNAGLYNVALEEGVINKDTDLLKPTFYMSEELKNDGEWLDEQVKALKRFRLGSLTQWADWMLRSMMIRFQ